MYCKKLKSFSYNVVNTVIQAQPIIQRTMSVNPNLAALMRVIEENQDKILEGEYLEAMNALGALHRQQEEQLRQTRSIPPASQQYGSSLPNRGGTAPTSSPPSYAESRHLFASPAATRVFPPGMDGNESEQRAWLRVKTRHPDAAQHQMSPEDWIALPNETRYQLLRETTEHIIKIMEIKTNNPDPKVCPFVARHAVGSWTNRDGGEYHWECVCGYTGKFKNWQKHEKSERHQDWAKHRTVSRRKIEKMKEANHDDEVGSFMRFAAYGSPTYMYPGGIRYFPHSQERNEWTHPELFAEFHRSPIPVFHLDEGGNVGKTTTTWFVHPRNSRSPEYIRQ